jgi:hypothetical protein
MTEIGHRRSSLIRADPRLFILPTSVSAAPPLAVQPAG